MGYIAPCFGMNEHPIARMDTILRQCEAPVKIYSSIRVPASIYRFKWSIMAGQGSNMKEITKKSKKHFFFEFYIDPGVQGAIREGPEPLPELKNDRILIFSIFHFFAKIAQK